MKILLLSCSTGEGHNSAAKAIGEAAKRRKIEYVIADPVAFASEKAKNVVSSAYNNMIKHTPKMFGAVYKIGDLFERTGVKSPIYFANASYAENLDKYIRSGGFDAVICTHLFGMESMTAVRHKKNNPVPCYGVLTDYTCIPFFAEPSIDGYFIPHKDLTAELAGKGFDKSSLYPTGIPVSSRFTSHIGKEKARTLLGISGEKKVIMIMSGGVGCEKIKELCSEFLKIKDENLLIYFFTGRNEKMAEKLNRIYKSNTRINIVPFTDKVNMYMDASDVLMTKPGGLSSTEAAVFGIPIVHIMTIPGCETRNAEFFARHNMSLRADNNADAVRCALKLAENKNMAETMKGYQRLNTNADSADMILDRVTENGNF
ncbi:MAG: glycosyltransferase [Ruminococcus sp.]|nr:glycosyltransferase [Ruminococcus sp.]